MKLYAVGGAVRDYLRGMPGKDLDFAVEAESFPAMMDALRERGFQAWQERPEFVTVRGRIPLDSLGKFSGLLPTMPKNPLGKTLPMFVAADFTLCRAETQYSDLRHPDTVTPADLVTDLARRDFTINAIAIAEDGTYIDPHHGRQDLQDKTLRTVGRPWDRFAEDPLRMLRAIRFAVAMNLWIDFDTSRAMNDRDVIDKLTTLPVERVVNELQLAFKLNWREAMLKLIVDYPDLSAVLHVHFPEMWFRVTTEDR